MVKVKLTQIAILFGIIMSIFEIICIIKFNPKIISMLYLTPNPYMFNSNSIKIIKTNHTNSMIIDSLLISNNYSIIYGNPFISNPKWYVI